MRFMPPEQFKGELETKRPMLKDLIWIDGEWAQYVGRSDNDLLKVLGTGEFKRLDLNEYQLVTEIQDGLLNYIKSEPEEHTFSKHEVDEISAGATPLTEITVFGV